jgi:hypothetical protein
MHFALCPSTRRSANAPQRIYDATKANAITGTLANNGNSFENALTGIPFPLPASGLEVMWNHLARYRGVSASRHIAQAAPTRSGNYTLVQFEDEFLFNYARPDVTAAQLENILVYYKQAVTAPARQAGTILLAHETLDQVKEKRSAWVYNTGQRRVRRAPDVAYDNPGTASDNMRTSDQLDMFNVSACLKPEPTSLRIELRELCPVVPIDEPTYRPASYLECWNVAPLYGFLDN